MRRPIAINNSAKADLISALGLTRRNKRELTSTWAERADIYVDVPGSTQVGDFRAWIAKGTGLFSGEGESDLLRLLRYSPRNPERRPRIFISTESALFDNLTIAYLIERMDSKKNVN